MDSREYSQPQDVQMRASGNLKWRTGGTSCDHHHLTRKDVGTEWRRRVGGARGCHSRLRRRGCVCVASSWGLRRTSALVRLAHAAAQLDCRRPRRDRWLACRQVLTVSLSLNLDYRRLELVALGLRRHDRGTVLDLLSRGNACADLDEAGPERAPPAQPRPPCASCLWSPWDACVEGGGKGPGELFCLDACRVTPPTRVCKA